MLYPDVASAEVSAVLVPADAECLAELRRAIAQLFGVRRILPAAPRKQRDPLYRLQGTQEHSAAETFLLCYHIAAEVHAVCEVHIEVSSPGKHDIVACGAAAVCVTRRVQLSKIRLNFDDPTCQPAPGGVADQIHPEKLPGDVKRRLEIKRAGELVTRHDVWRSTPLTPAPSR